MDFQNIDSSFFVYFVISCLIDICAMIFFTITLVLLLKKSREIKPHKDELTFEALSVMKDVKDIKSEVRQINRKILATQEDFLMDITNELHEIIQDAILQTRLNDHFRALNDHFRALKEKCEETWLRKEKEHASLSRKMNIMEANMLTYLKRLDQRNFEPRNENMDKRSFQTEMKNKQAKSKMDSVPKIKNQTTILPPSVEYCELLGKAIVTIIQKDLKAAQEKGFFNMMSTIDKNLANVCDGIKQEIMEMSTLLVDQIRKAMQEMAEDHSKTIQRLVVSSYKSTQHISEQVKLNRDCISYFYEFQKSTTSATVIMDKMASLTNTNQIISANFSKILIQIENIMISMDTIKEKLQIFEQRFNFSDTFQEPTNISFNDWFDDISLHSPSHCGSLDSNDDYQ